MGDFDFAAVPGYSEVPNWAPGDQLVPAMVMPTAQEDLPYLLGGLDAMFASGKPCLPTPPLAERTMKTTTTSPEAKRRRRRTAAKPYSPTAAYPRTSRADEDARWPEELLALGTRELNRALKTSSYTAAEQQEIKRARRRRLNRTYARVSRRKRSLIRASPSSSRSGSPETVQGDSMESMDLEQLLPFPCLE
jgi:hypothetical protein